MINATVDELKKHGKRFSQTFKKDHGLWVDDFDSMALKTVIKANLSKWAPLSVDIQKAITFDQSVIKDVETQDVDYVDNQPEQLPEVTHDELQKLLEVKLALLNKAEFDNAKRILDNKEEASYKKLFTLLTEKTDE